MKTINIVLASSKQETVAAFDSIVKSEKNWQLTKIADIAKLFEGLKGAVNVLLLDNAFSDLSTAKILARITKVFPKREFSTIVLCERTASLDFLELVNQGADEFLRDPFEPSITVARIRSQMKKNIRHEEVGLRERAIRVVAKQLAHDIANPLSVIVGYLQNMQVKKAYIESAVDTMVKAGFILNEMLNQARLTLSNEFEDDPDPAWLSIDTLIDDIEPLIKDRLAGKELVIKKTNHQVLAGLDVYCEPISLKYSIVSNILTNAIKYSDRGESIGIDFSVEGEFLAIKFSNKGVVISEENLHEFRSVMTSKSQLGTEGEQGTGFGLNIIQFYMEAFKGKVDIQPTKDGTVVVIYLKSRKNS